VRLPRFGSLRARADLAVENARLRRRIEFLELTDPTTGLLHARAFDAALLDVVRSAIARSLPAALVVIDVDGFAALALDHGHAAAEDALRALATSIRAHFGDRATYGRVGYDRFGAALPDTIVAEAYARAERLRRDAADAATIGAEPITVTLSAGVAGYPDDASTAVSLLAACARAASGAMRAGGNVVQAAGTHLAAQNGRASSSATSREGKRI